MRRGETKRGEKQRGGTNNICQPDNNARTGNHRNKEDIFRMTDGGKTERRGETKS